MPIQIRKYPRKIIRRFSKKITTKIFIEPFSPSVNRSVRKDLLTFLDITALNDLSTQVKQLEKNSNRNGIIIEAGCALGGSAIVMAKAKSKARPFYVYDAFGMIPPPSEKDGEDCHKRYKVIRSGQAKGFGGNKYYGYEENLFEKVNENFRQYGVPVDENKVYLVKGLFENVLHVNQPVALAHIDGDWYNSVMTCLQRIEPYLEQGGVLVIDDYYGWSGCRKAVDDYFSDKQSSYEFIRKSRLHIIRK
jgi:hypothetical protein